MAPPPKDEPLLAMDEIQGNVIPGFLKDHQHFVFFSIDDPAAARTCLSKMHSRLSTAAEVVNAHSVWKSMRKRLGREPQAAQFIFLNVALSASGLRKLVQKTEVDLFGDAAFKVGLAARSTFIGDPEKAAAEGHAAKWLVGGTKKPVDGVLIAASDNLSWLTQECRKLETEIAKSGMSVVHRDEGNVNAAPIAGHEHFGFKDGISQPAIRGRWPKDPWPFVSARNIPPGKDFDPLRPDFAEPGRRLVWPGHFLFGYGRQQRDDSRTQNSADKPAGPPWATNGSFMVYRRLRQKPDAFAKFVDGAAKALAKKYPKAALGKDRLAALLVGRWPSGTPIMRSPDKDIAIVKDGLNYFSFAKKQTPALPGDTAPLNAADPDGMVCPLAAHIRKVNPRDETTEQGFAERTVPRLLLRRGITYAANKNDKGLLFVSYQSSVVEQFEFLMRFWVNQPDGPRAAAGHDPLLFQGAGHCNLRIGKSVEKLATPGTFVVPTGGEYFFSPSIAFFRTTLAGMGKK